MTAHFACLRGCARAALFAAAVLPFGCEAATAVYKCRDADGGVMYTDVACHGGEEVALRAGDADPAAIERLARAQQAASERFARERAVAASEAAQLRFAEASQTQTPSAEAAIYCEYCGVTYGYAATPEAPRSHHPHRTQKRVVPLLRAR